MSGNELSGITVIIAAICVLVGTAGLSGQDRAKQTLNAALAAVGAATLVRHYVSAGPHDTPSAIEFILVGLHLLTVTIAASLGFAFVREITRAPILRPWNPTAIGSAVAVMQVIVLFAVYVSQSSPLTALLITAAWPAIVLGWTIATLHALGGFVRRAQRAGMAMVVAGSLAMGVGTALSAAAPYAPGQEWFADENPATAIVSGVGLLAFGVGVKAASLARVVSRSQRLLMAVRVLRRARPLVQSLTTVAGEWAPERESGIVLLRRPIEQAYCLLVFVRDASFGLQPLVDAAERDAAVQYARRYAGRNELAVAALAESCWLALAIERFHRGHPALVEQDSVFLDPWDLPRNDTASVSAELAFLAAVARTWTQTAVLEAFVRTNTTWPPPPPATTTDRLPGGVEYDDTETWAAELAGTADRGRHHRAPEG